MPNLVCAVARECPEYMVEWLAYYRITGWDQAVIYDNGCELGTREAVTEAGLSDFVKWVDWPERPGQLSAYGDFILTHGSGPGWVAFVDLDEFLLPLEHDTIGAYLAGAPEDAAAVLPNWLVFGPSGHVDRPAGLQIENYTQRLPDTYGINRHIKTIARLSAVRGTLPPNPHNFRLRGEFYDAAWRRIENIPIQPIVCNSGLVINHYYTGCDSTLWGVL